MNNIEQIQNSPELQIELTKLLLAKIEPETCWHEKFEIVNMSDLMCLSCGSFRPNPNLFASGEEGWIAFGRMIEAIQKRLRDEYEDREDYKDFLDGSSFITYHEEVSLSHVKPIVFAYLLLGWLDPEGLERVMKEETS